MENDRLSTAAHGARGLRAKSVTRQREWWLAFAMVIVLSDALDRLLLELFGVRPLLGVLPITRLPLLLVFMAAIWLLGRDRRGAIADMRAIWFVWPAVLLAFGSVTWSGQPATSLLWATVLLGTSLFGVALALRFTLEEQVVLVVGALSSIVLCSLLLAAVSQPAGLTGNHELRGIYHHRNLFGKAIALGAVAAAVMVASDARRRSQVALVLCASAVVASYSAASLVSALIGAAIAVVLWAARRWRHHQRLILVAGTAVTVLVAAALIGTQAGLALLDRSATFSGRTRIWRMVYDAAMETPWLGHGYGAFWPSPGGQWITAELLKLIPIPINHAHNGVLDLFAELGVVGVVLVLAAFLVVALAAFRYALTRPDAAAIWPATYLVFFLASNAAESAFFRHKIFWALYVSVACVVLRPKEKRGRCLPPGW